MAKYKRIINGECNFQMIELFDDLQKLKDLQAKAHEEYLDAKRKVEEKQQDSFKLIWQIEQTKEELMRR